MTEALTDTKEKLIMKDHDILIAVYTQVTDLLRRYDENQRFEQERSQSLAIELKGIAVEQVRVSTQLKGIEDEQVQLEKRMDKLESKSNVWDLVNSFGVLVSAYIGYIFGSK